MVISMQYQYKSKRQGNDGIYIYLRQFGEANLRIAYIKNGIGILQEDIWGKNVSESCDDIEKYLITTSYDPKVLAILGSNPTNTVGTARWCRTKIEAGRVNIEGLAVEGKADGGDRVTRDSVEALADIGSFLGTRDWLVELSNITKGT